MARVTPPEPGSDADDAAIARRIAEYHAVARAPLSLGFLAAALGVVAAVVKGLAWPAMPAALPAACIIAALGLMGIGFMRRARYHWRQIRESKR